MAVNGDIIQVIDEQSFAGQVCLNVFHYSVDGAAVDIADLSPVFQGQLVDKIAVIQSTSLEHVKLTLKNLTDGVELYEETYSTPYTGLRGGEYLPSFNAWAFKLNRQTQATRNGQKRIAGVAEQDIVGNLPDAGFVAALNTAANFMGNPIYVNDFTNVVPVIVRKTPLGVVTAINAVTNCTFSRISSQNSRKQY